MITAQIHLASRTLLTGVMLLLLAPSPGWGEEAATEELPNRFMVRGGYGLVFNADTIFRFNGASGVGSTVDFARTLGRVLHRPALLPAPAFALRLLAGEFSSELLSSKRVLPKVAEVQGYRFLYPELEGALRQVVAS